VQQESIEVGGLAAPKVADRDAARWRSVVDASPNPVMLCDRNLTVLYANPATMEALRPLERFLPIKVSQLVGQSIDIFHKNPSHQRRLLADPRNLPHSARIKVGPETLDLKAYALTDEAGTYLGPCLAWEVVSDRARMEERDRETRGQIEVASTKLSTSAVDLGRVSSQMAAGATQTAAQVAKVSSAATQIRASVSQVASAAEELAATVREIAGNANESAKVTRSAREQATSANATVQALSSASAAIGKVTKVISTIAQQTNLLALNATIEAARAGEAGKGFAVVANEVKELAKETARATEEISKQIEGIQAETLKSVQAIGAIVKVMEQAEGIATSIAASVEEQAATVKDIARNATEVSGGVGSVVDNISHVAAAAKDSEQTASLTQANAQAIRDLAAELAALVGREG